MIAIQTIHLSKKYGSKTAVHDLNLNIASGELFALLGVNGAGKTTTIKMLSGLCRPTSGDALLLGDSIVRDPEKVKQKINVSPQETAVAAALSVRENLNLIAGIYGFDRANAAAKTEESIADFDLGEVAASRAKTLSGGMQRRLSIAMALISAPQVLFLDEPTLGLDVLARRELWTAIEKLKGKITIILTTHYMEEAEALSDRLAIMARGQIKTTGTAREIMSQTHTANLEDAFVSLATAAEEVHS